MPNVCILTDSTAQFTQPNYPGHERVYTIPFGLQIGNRQEDHPLRRNGSLPQQLIPPTPKDFLQHYTHLSREYDAIIVLIISSLLNPVMKNALSASIQFSNHACVEVVDSQTTAIGLGLLVQDAAEAATSGAALADIERQVRATIPRIYMLVCIPELTYLAQSGYIDFAQALVGEMMGILPVFTVEEGRLAPLEKVRTPRHLFESFQDFMSEFETPAHIALVRGVSHTTARMRPLRQFVRETFPRTPYSEHPIQPHLAALFGSQSVSLVVKDTTDRGNHENRFRD